MKEKEFVLLFRSDIVTKSDAPSPEQMQASMKQWQDWMGGIAAQNKLASPGNRLNSEGRVVRPGNAVTNGPYAEIKEGIGGYIIVNAADFDEAVEIAKGCPIFSRGGNVEVRMAIAMDDNS